MSLRQRKLNLPPIAGGVRVHSAAAECAEVPGRGGPGDGQLRATGQAGSGHGGASHSSCSHLLSQPGNIVNTNY